jgi:hypothetical protein
MKIFEWLFGCRRQRDITLAMTAEEAWREYRKTGEAVESFESFKRRWDHHRKLEMGK